MEGGTGNGAGPSDALITFLAGPFDERFDHALTGADFASASAGPAAAFTLTLPTWLASLPSDPSASWIATDVGSGLSGTPGYDSGLGRTALFAIDFTVTELIIDSAWIDFRFLVDNQVGDDLNEGLFINGQPVTGTKLLGINSSYFQSQQAFLQRDITLLLVPGSNTLNINQVDFGFSSGINFSAEIRVNPVPEPSIPVLLAIASGWFAWRRWSV